MSYRARKARLAELEQVRRRRGASARRPRQRRRLRSRCAVRRPRAGLLTVLRICAVIAWNRRSYAAPLVRSTSA